MFIFIYLVKMKLLILFSIICASLADGSISYLCDRCDLYDLDSRTIFESLGLPGMDRGPRPDYTNCGEQSPAEKYSPVMICVTLVVGFINLIATITILVGERNTNSSARKTYMQTAILE